MKIVAFTGAGISKASGIPTFEDIGQDVRDKLERQYFTKHPDEIYNILKDMKLKFNEAQPNPAHLALARYGIHVATMNVDGLHQKAGSQDVIEMHGNVRHVNCHHCKKQYDFNIVYTGIKCPECGNVLQPEVVLYGDMAPMYQQALDIAGEADRLLIIGTSFYTTISTTMVKHARRRRTLVFTINQNAEEVVPQLLGRWFDGNSKGTKATCTI